MTTRQAHSMTSSRVPLPAWAVEAFEWEVEGDQVSRTFRGGTRGDAVQVAIYGRQDITGRVVDQQMILVSPNNRHGTAEIDADTARRLAADLLAAADEVAAGCWAS